jgi:hypothetical protein
MSKISVIFENNNFYNVQDPMGTGHIYIMGDTVRLSNVSFFNSEVIKGLTVKANKAVINDISFTNSPGISKTTIFVYSYDI